MQMVTCKRCGGNCDNGEVIGGVCLECLEEEKMKLDRESSMARMLNSVAFQMEMNFEEAGNLYR